MSLHSNIILSYIWLIAEFQKKLLYVIADLKKDVHDLKVMVEQLGNKPGTQVEQLVFKPCETRQQFSALDEAIKRDSKKYRRLVRYFDVFI